MKKIFLLIAIFISFIAGAQLPTISGVTKINQKYQWLGMIPPNDTIYLKWGFAYLLIDGKAVQYWGDGVSWHKSIVYIGTNPLPGDNIVLGADASTFVNAALTPKTGVVGNVTVIDNGNLSYTVLYPQGYFIAGTYYPGGSGTITLPVGTAGVDSGRVDLIELTAAGAGSEQGSNSDNPQAPVPDLQTTIPITTVLILSNATVPAPANTSTNRLVYNEHIASPTETTVSTTNVTANADAATAGLAFNGTKYISITSFTANTGQINFTFPDTLTKSNYTNLNGYIRINTAWNAATQYSVSLVYGATVSNAVPLTTWGIVKGTTGSYKPFSIPMSAFTGSPQFTAIRITRTGTGGTVNWLLDYVQLQASGVTSTGAGTDIYHQNGTIVDPRRDVTMAGHTVSWNGGTSNFQNLDSVGTVINYPWSTNPMTLGDGTSTASVTTDGVSTVIGGTVGLNVNNYVTFGRYVGTENFTVHFKIIMAAKNNTSYGFMFNIPPSSGMGQGISVHYHMTDTAYGYSSYTYVVGVPDYAITNKSQSRMTGSASDTIDVTVQKLRRTIISVARNLTNGTETRMVINDVFPQVGIPTLYFYSGAKMVGNFTLTYNDVKHPDIVFLGHSIAWGGSASTLLEAYYAKVATRFNATYTLMAGPSEATLDALKRIPEVLESNPKICIIDHNVNDFPNYDSFSARMQRIITPIKAAGIQILLITGRPNDGFSMARIKDSVIALANRNGILYADNYTPELDPAGGTGMNPIYAFGDGTHPNKYGHAQDAAIISKQVEKILPPRIPITKRQLGISSDLTDEIVVRKIDGTEATRPYGIDTSNILNKKIILSGDAQNGNYQITGYGVMGGIQVLGAGTVNVSPVFWITPGGAITINPFTVNGGGFYTSPGALTGQDGGQLRFSSGAVIDVLTQPLITRSRNWNSTTGLHEWTNIDNGHDATPFDWLSIYKNVSSVRTDLLKINQNGNIWMNSYPDGTAASDDSVVVVKDGILSVKTVSGGGGGGSGWALTGASTLTGNTTIDVNTRGLHFTTTNSAVDIRDNLFSVEMTDGLGADAAFSVDPSAGITTSLSSGLVFVGGATDSSNYAGESYVQKDWVLNHIANAGANQQLSNLSGTIAINAALLPGTANSLSLGSASKTWKHIFLDNSGTINWGNGDAVLSHTAAAEITAAPADGTFRVFKSGQANTVQVINSSFTDGISIQGQSNTLRSLTGSSNMNMQIGASENLGIGTGAPTSKLTVFGSLAVAYSATATGITLDGTQGVVKVTATGQTITLPTAVGITGREYTIKITASGSCTIATTSSQTIDGSTTYSLASQYKYATVVSDGANWIVVANN